MLAAVADAEAIEISDDDMLEALQIPPGHEDHGHPEPAQALKELKESGRDMLLAEDLRLRRALDTIAESASPIAAEQAEAREKIWTPEKEREEKGGLWTPETERSYLDLEEVWPGSTGYVIRPSSSSTRRSSSS